MRVARLVAAAALILAAVVALAWRSQVRDSDDLAVAESARSVLEIDARLDRAVLESQAGLSLNYDEASETVRDLVTAERQMEEAAAGIDDGALQGEIRAAREDERERERLVESFESLNSVFRNSAAFLPVAAKHATSTAASGPSGDAARHSVAELLEDVLACRAGCPGALLDAVGEDISRLKDAASALPSGDRPAFDVVLRHARQFHAYAPKLQATVLALVRMHGDAYADIAATVAARGEVARRRANYFRSGLAVLCFGLVSALAVAGSRLRRGAAALEEVLLGLAAERKALAEKQFELAALNHHLESRVAQRTRDLSASRDQYRLLVETTQAIPFELDATTLAFRYLGPQATVLLGYSPSECAQEGFLSASVHADDRDAVVHAFSAAGASDVEEVEFRMSTSKGRWVWLRAFVSRPTEARARLRRGVLLDSTTRRELEATLRGAQKLESVGRLASGIAHEINTPVQFVSDNVRFVSDAVGTLAALLQAYRAAHSDPELRAREAEADLEYILEDAPRALRASLEGLDRIASIVRAMKGFAHPDRVSKSAADLNLNIRNTLTIARSEYSSVAVLHTDLGELPPVHCHAGEINQVLLNLVTNAAHAIADKVAGTGELGEISVRSWRDDRDVVISVRDTGGGVPESHRERLFEPFFTTKDVGAGTGQGLAISRSLVVDKHGGDITFETEIGRGTEFRVRLPIEGSERRRRGPEGSSLAPAAA